MIELLELSCFFFKLVKRRSNFTNKFAFIRRDEFYIFLPNVKSLYFAYHVMQVK